MFDRLFKFYGNQIKNKVFRERKAHSEIYFWVAQHELDDKLELESGCMQSSAGYRLTIRLQCARSFVYHVSVCSMASVIASRV